MSETPQAPSPEEFLRCALNQSEDRIRRQFEAGIDKMIFDRIVEAEFGS